MNTIQDCFSEPLSVRRFLIVALLSASVGVVQAAGGVAHQPPVDDFRGWVPTQRLTAHGNQAGLRLQMVPGKNRHRLGDTMQIRVTSPEEGYLFLLDINSAGQLTRIFPNKYSQAAQSQRGLSRIPPNSYYQSPAHPGYIKAGQTVMIPDDNYGFDFTASEPVGKGLVVALLIEEDFVYNMALPGEFETIPASETYSILQWLNNYLNDMLETDDSVGRPARWSIATLDYEISR